MATDVKTSILKLYELAKNFGMRSKTDEGLLNFVNEVRLAVGLNEAYLVNNCETVGDFTEDPANQLDVATDAANNKIGTNSIKLSSTVASAGKVQTTEIENSSVPGVRAKDGVAQMDWRNSDYVGFWFRGNGAAHFGAAGDLKFNIKNNGTWGTAVNVPAATNAVWQRVEIDISGFTRDRVEAIRFENNNADAAEDVQVDYIIRYKFGNGKGPVWGSTIKLPIKSAVTLALGNIAEFEPSTTHRLDLESAAGADTLGPVCIGGVGDANGTVYGVVQVDGLAYLRASAALDAGEGVEWAASHKVAGVAAGVGAAAAGNFENVFAKALEAPSAADADIKCHIGMPSRSI